MPRQSSLAVAVKRVAMTYTLPAPVGGLNARDSLALMKPEQAVVLDNFFPVEFGVKVRRGWGYWWRVPDAVTNQRVVRSLIKYAGQDGSEQLFAAVGGNFYDVTNASNTLPPAAINFNGDYWQFVQMANAFGTFTIACNGADNPVKYDGVNWTQCVLTADPGVYPDFDPTRLIGVGLQHRRLFFIEGDSCRVWYLPVDQVSGDVRLFDVGEIFPHGGFVVGVTYWSSDTGAGMDSLNVFISSMGDIAVFSGYDVDQPNDGTATDPSAPYKQVAVYKTGRTLGFRCFKKYGSDVMVLSEAGMTLISQMLAQTKMLMQPPFSDIIQQVLSTDITSYAKNTGWEIATIDRYQMVILNIPDPAYNFRQYVMNDITQAWCTFSGYHAFCWGTLQEEPYFGADGYVGRAWYGNVDALDPVTSKGVSVNTRALQAFNYLGQQTAEQKLFTMVRPIFNSAGTPQFTAGINVDFGIEDNTLLLPNYGALVSLPKWNEAFWDQALWTEAKRSFSQWIDVNGVGYNAAPLVKTATVNETFWVATDISWLLGQNVF